MGSASFADLIAPLRVPLVNKRSPQASLRSSRLRDQRFRWPRYARVVSNRPSPRFQTTAAVSVAAVLACCYSVVLVVLAVALGIDWATGRGTAGNLASPTANRGVLFFLIVCIGGAALLVFRGVTAWRGRRGIAAIVPLAIVAGAGVICEPIDIAGGSPLTSSLIGG